MSQNNGATKARRIPYLLLLYFACAGASLYLLHTADYNEFVTVFGFHAQKLALSSLLLFLAMLTGVVPYAVGNQRRLRLLPTRRSP